MRNRDQLKLWFQHPDFSEWMDLTADMKFPKGQSLDISWFVTDGDIENKDHPNFERAITLAKDIDRLTKN